MNTPRAVVLVPNRELAYQVGEMAATLCNSVGLVASSLVGGKFKFTVEGSVNHQNCYIMTYCNKKRKHPRSESLCYMICRPFFLNDYSN